MRRKTDKEILKENCLLIILSTILVLLGIFIAMLPHIAPHVGYDSLQTKEVTITKFKHHYGGVHSASYDYIRTTDSEKHNLSGDYQREQLQKLRTEGKTATIMWHKNKPFRTLLAEEMYVDGERVITYDNDKPVDWKPPLIFGCCFIALGIGGFFLLRVLVKTNRNKQKNEMRKYNENTEIWQNKTVR